MNALLGVLGRPFGLVVDGLGHCLADQPGRLLTVLLGLVLGWWLYVPVHEVLHALGCLATGGEVSRLEVQPWYGGTLLARALPFVVAGGSYAGRLSGFHTGGSDVVYLATVMTPYLLTVFPGVWLLRVGAEKGHPLLFGLMLPMALAPFLSLAGDAYEVGSIVVTWWPTWSAWQGDLRSDDLFRLAAQLWHGGAGSVLWLGMALGFLAGVGWAYLTWYSGEGVAGLLTREAGQRREG